MYSTTDKKDPGPTEYFIHINADYKSTCGYYRVITTEQTVFRQSRQENTPQGKENVWKLMRLCFRHLFPIALYNDRQAYAELVKKGLKQI